MTDRGPWWDTGRLAEDGHPAYYQTTELRTLLILEVWIDGEPVTFRDAVETFIWIEQFADPERRESYLTYWIRKQVGMLAADPDRLTALRRKLMVVEPKDQHDYARCKTSSENAIMFIRCDHGEIRRHPMPLLMSAYEAGVPQPEPVRLGACLCRCHDMQRRAMGGPPRMLPADQYFRESMLSEEEALQYGCY